MNIPLLPDEYSLFCKELKQNCSKLNRIISDSKYLKIEVDETSLSNRYEYLCESDEHIVTNSKECSEVDQNLGNSTLINFLIKMFLRSTDSASSLNMNMFSEHLCDVGAYKATLRNQVARMEILSRTRQLEKEKQKKISILNELLKDVTEDLVKKKLECINYQAQLNVYNKKRESLNVKNQLLNRNMQVMKHNAVDFKSKMNKIEENLSLNEYFQANAKLHTRKISNYLVECSQKTKAIQTQILSLRSVIAVSEKVVDSSTESIVEINSCLNDRLNHRNSLLELFFNRFSTNHLSSMTVFPTLLKFIELTVNNETLTNAVKNLENGKDDFMEEQKTIKVYLNKAGRCKEKLNESVKAYITDFENTKKDADQTIANINKVVNEWDFLKKTLNLH